MADEHTANAAPNAAQSSSRNSEAAAKSYLSPDELAARIREEMDIKNINKKLHAEAEKRKNIASKANARSKEEYLNKIREDARAAEGDRIADEKQKRIDGIKNARIYSARRAAEEEQTMAEETKLAKGDYNATDKQRALILKNYDKLHPYHKAHIDKKMLASGELFSAKMASQAISTYFAMEKLKSYMPEEDIAKLAVKEVIDKEKDFKDKPTTKMKAFMKSCGIEFDEHTTMAQAKEMLNNRPASEKQIATLKKFMDVADDKIPTAGEASILIDQCIKRNQDEYREYMEAPVSKAIRETAIDAGLIKEGQKYTNAEWAKDARNIPPTPGVKAQLAYYQIELKPDSKHPEQEPNNLYNAMVAIRATKRRLEENKFAPVTEQQQSELSRAGYVYANSRLDDGSHSVIPGTYAQAQEAVWDARYTQGLLGYSDAKYLVTHPDVPVPENFMDAKKLRLDLPEAEREAIRKETHQFVVEDKEKRRMVAILNCPAYPRERTMLQDTAKLVAYSHYDREKGVIKDDAVKDMAVKLLSCKLPSELDLGRIPQLKDKDGNAIAPTKNQYLAHVIASTLPQCADNYKEHVMKLTQIVGKVEKAMEIAEKNQDKKAEIQKEASASKAKSKAKTAGNSGLGA